MVIARILRNIGPAINTVLPGRCAVLNDRTLANAASTCMAEQHAARRKFGAYWGSIIDYQYYLHATGRSAFVPSKASFFNALRGGGIVLKHVKNAYVGSIRLAAAVRALPKTAATCSEPAWHPSGSHVGRDEVSELYITPSPRI